MEAKGPRTGQIKTMYHHSQCFFLHFIKNEYSDLQNSRTGRECCQQSLRNTFNFLKSVAGSPSAGCSCNLSREPSVPGKLLHFTQAGLNSSKVDSSVVHEKSRFGKTPTHICLTRWILRSAKQALLYLSALVFPLSYLPASKAALILKAHLRRAKEHGVRVLSQQ